MDLSQSQTAGRLEKIPVELVMAIPANLFLIFNNSLIFKSWGKSKLVTPNLKIMKTRLLILIILTSWNVCFAQEVIPEKTFEDYRRAGQSELIIGTIFVAGSIPIFLSLAGGNVDLDSYPLMIAGGVILLGGGIVLLSSSGKNFDRARKLSVSAEFEKIELTRLTSKVSAGVPGISLKWSFY